MLIYPHRQSNHQSYNAQAYDYGSNDERLRQGINTETNKFFNRGILDHNRGFTSSSVSYKDKESVHCVFHDDNTHNDFYDITLVYNAVQTNGEQNERK